MKETKERVLAKRKEMRNAKKDLKILKQQGNIKSKHFISFQSRTCQRTKQESIEPFKESYAELKAKPN